MLPSPRLAASLVALVALASSPDAAADKPGASDHVWQIYAPVGVNLGSSRNPKRLDNGFILGGEASVAAVNKDFLWGGAYIDALHDFGAKSTRISIGPELGLFLFGLDAGFVISTLDGVHGGIVGRVLITLPVVSGYARAGTIFGSPQEGVYGELGVLLKIPVPIDTGGAPPMQRKVAPPPSPPPPDPPPPPPDPPPDLPVAT